MVLIASGCGGARSGGQPDPAKLTLQRSDLPPVYRRGDDSSCGSMGTEGAPPRLARLVVSEQPHACVLQLERAYGTEPPLVESAALVFRDEEGASRGLAAADQVVAFLMGEFPKASRRADAPQRIGDETIMLVPAGGVTVEGYNGRPGRVLVWRSGNVLAAVLVAGVPNRQAEARAVVLARRQQRRIERPEPVTTTSDAEVGLDDPALEVPVYWLGASFAPDGFPPVGLRDASRETPTSGPGNQLKLDYYDDGVRAGFHLDTWTPAAWKRFARTDLGNLLRRSPCTKATMLRLPDRTATIYAGYAAQGTAACPQEPPDAYEAVVEIGGVVVAVNMPYCLSCRTPPPGYNSRAGMEVIVKSLKLRP